MICPACKLYCRDLQLHACSEDEQTTEFVLAERCPSCRSLDTEPFETHVDGTKHCIPCGKVFK